jgi:hypothetical protein
MVANRSKLFFIKTPLSNWRGLYFKRLFGLMTALLNPVTIRSLSKTSHGSNAHFVVFDVILVY